MKRIVRIVCLILVICVFFAGCKSDDYKEAVALQEAGDYAAALLPKASQRRMTS